MVYSKCFPAWGPYGKKYMGISRIADHDFMTGVRFDMTVAPAIFGGDIKVPNTTLPSGCHPWRCSPDYSFFTYRHDLEWKDKVYAEVSYVRINDESTLIRTEIVNNSELIQNCLINYFESIEYPELDYCRLFLPEKCEYKNALDYEKYEYAVKAAWDRNVPDGFKRGEFKDGDFAGGYGLGNRIHNYILPVYQPFGGEKGDIVSYKIGCKNSYKNAVLAVRYRTPSLIHGRTSADTSDFICNGKTISFPYTDKLDVITFDLGEVAQGDIELTLEAVGNGGIELDFLCICEKEDAADVKAEIHVHNFMPDIKTEKAATGYITACKYENVDGVFTLRTFNDNTRFREIETGAIEDCMSARLSNSDHTFDDLTESFTNAFSRKHSDEGYYHNTLVHTLFIEPGEKHTEYAVISKGDTEYLTAEEYEKLYNERYKESEQISFNKEGEKYTLSCEILKSTLFANAVYPIYKHGEDIIHHTPGKRWDCLYTWDSGFIGLGMAEFSDTFANYSLDTYLSDESNPDYAFLHHGSPVPVQFYLYLEMLKKHNDKAKLLEMYPRLKLYYEFLAGRARGSTTAKLRSGITSTYDYFYSTSGMDDYPPQVYINDNGIRATTAPALSASQLIRCGKILKMAAHRLGFEEDIKVIDSDIERLTAALNKYSWDPESGYFSYVLHDENYEPTEILRTADGENLNKGLDGIYPLIAGVCNDEQKEKILGHLMNKNEMLSPFGISAVDMSAGYFIVNGYWNGNVWFPHQWFIWKTMLDLGKTDFAYTIAELALNIWKREVDYSYYTFEMVNVVTGRGGWFHNFGGLSTPILMWANAYFKSGSFNTGFDTWVENAVFSEENTKLTAEISYFGNNDKTTAIVTLSDKKSGYKAYLDGKEIASNERFCGTVEIELNITDNEMHTLEVY